LRTAEATAHAFASKDTILHEHEHLPSSPPDATSMPNHPANDDGNNPNITQERTDEEELILKIKVQIPDDPSTAPSNPTGTTTMPPPPPSPPTSHELKALTIFRDFQTPSAPRLIAFSHFPQPDSTSSPMPREGYISSTVMSKIAGKSLFEIGYWSLASPEQEEIQRGFLGALG
jgi:hypothetical protein